MADSSTDIFDIIHTTRAMRRLKPDPVPDELIRKIIEAGLSAANGGNVQTWRFMVVKDRKMKEGVQVYYKKLYDAIVGPRYAGDPPPGMTKERFQRTGASNAYLTDHF